MKVSEIMISKIISLNLEDTVAKALNVMYENNINQIPIADDKENYGGMIFAKDFLIVNAIDIIKILATPRERATKSPGVGTMATIREVKVKDIARRSVSVERGTKLNQVSEYFRRNEEIIIVGEKRPIGIVTPKDLLELILPKDTGPSIHMAHLEDNEVQREIEEEMKRFLNKIQGKLENINQVIIYADKHKTRKYSLRA